jgi:glutamate synthase (NADPH/NADH) small chain
LRGTAPLHQGEKRLAEKKKLNLQREPIPRQDPQLRAHNFDEVALGYSVDQAKREADRCLGCKKPFCVAGCPVEVDIPGFVRLIQEGDFVGGARVIKETNSLPAICGRVCPQEDQCEKLCVLAKKGAAVAIGRLERFVADYEAQHQAVEIPQRAPSTGKKVAVVGAGPAGLTVAGDLAKLGHGVTIFEALHEPGGVLIYGIPEFRLPKVIVKREVDYVTSLGAELNLSYVVGQTQTVDEFLESVYDAVFLGN